MNRRRTLTLFCVACLIPGVTRAQQTRLPRVGVLGHTRPEGYAAQIAALKEGLRELGYVEGRSMNLEMRWADDVPERLPGLAEELVRARVDVVVTSGLGSAAMFKATKTIPVVIAASGDPVGGGFAASLARPGGNFTGSAVFGPEIVAKRIELLKLAAPRVSRVAVLANPESASNRRILSEMRARAGELKVELVDALARAPRDLEGVFAAMSKQRVEGLVVLDESMLIANSRRIGQLAVAHRLVSVGAPTYADDGGLVGYGVDFPEMWRKAAGFVDRILKGASPATMPFERATKFTLVVNPPAAKAIGLQLPEELLLRADRVVA